MTAREIIDTILNIRELKIKDQNDLAMKCEILPNTLTVAIGRNKLGGDIVTKIHDKFGISKDFLKEGKEPIFEENHAQVEKTADNKLNGHSKKETFYTDLIEQNEEYSLIPRAVLKDYKIVPDKIIDVLVQSNENEKKALMEAMQVSRDALIEKHDRIIEGYKIAIQKLEEENRDLRRQIPPNN